MTTIAQLPLIPEVTPEDLLPISQQGELYAATVAQLTNGLQTTLNVPTGALLGRTSAGAGLPEAINLGLGLGLNSGSVVATGADHAAFPVQATLSLVDQIVIEASGQAALLPVTALRSIFAPGNGISIDENGLIGASASFIAGPTGSQGPVGPAGPEGPAGPQGVQGSGLSAPSVSNCANFINANDYIAIWQNGTNNWITYQQLIGGQTIDQLPSAGPAQDSDQILVAQNSNSLSSQSFSSIWSYVFNKLPTFKFSIVKLINNTVLNSTSHNGRILIISQPLTLSANYANMGPGFLCRVINLSSGIVTMGAGITAGTGSNILPPGSEAILTGLTYSGGSVVWWSGVAPTVPAITVSIVAPPEASTPFTISGNFYNFLTTSLDYSLDGVAWLVAPAPTIGPGIYTFVMPGLAPGTYTLHVRDHVNQSVTAVSNSFQVMTPSIVLNSLASNAVVGTAILVTGSVIPATALVQVGSSPSLTVPPVTFLTATSESGGWSATITPQATGITYVWAQQTTAPTISAISSVITVSGLSLTIDTPASATVGSTIPITGTVSSMNASVTVQFSTNNTVVPSAVGAPATVTGNSFSANLTPTVAGTFYIWAEDQGSNISAVSNAVMVTVSENLSYSINQPATTNYLRGSGTIAINGSINPAQNIATQAALSTSNSNVPTSGWQPASVIDNNTLWALYLTTPPQPGSYYVWVETEGGASAVVSTFTLTIT